jgi:hypothetical protein
LNLNRKKSAPHTHFFTWLLKSSVSIKKQSDNKKTDERQTGKDLEGNGHGLIEVLSQDLPRGAGENYEKPQSG